MRRPYRFVRTCLRAALLAGAGLALPGAAAPGALDPEAPLPPPEAAEQEAAAGIPLFLEVSLNGQPTQTVVSFYQLDGRLYADLEDLRQLGLETRGLQSLPPLQSIRLDRVHAGEGRLVALDRVPGLSYRYHAATQSIELQAGPGLVRPNAIGRRVAEVVDPSSAAGLVLNYDAFLQGSPDRGGATSFSVANEERLFSRLGLFDNRGVARVGGGQPGYTRLDSSWHDDDPRALTTLQAGDAISSALSWSRAVRLGGIQFRRNFALRPDLITFPLPTLGGSAAVPSAVDLYVNNVRQFSSEVPSGPFVINNPVALTGGGLARLVVRDELGREVSTTLPIYVDNRMVAGGLSSWSAEGGFLRRNYGLRSFDYGGTPAASGSYRYGWSEALTLEGHGEAAAGVYDGGGGALLRLGQWGVANASLAGGSAGGAQAGLGYQLILPRLSFIAQTIRSYGPYRDLASIGGTPPPRIFDQLNLSLPIRRTQTLGLSYIHSRGATTDFTPGTTGGGPANGPASGASRIASLTYTAQLRRWCTLFANAYRNLGGEGSGGFWVGLSFDLGHRLVGFASGGRAQDQDNYGASLVRSADYGGGWEWGLQDNESGSSYNRLARAAYLGRYGELGAAAQYGQNQTLLSLEGNGGLVYMDGTLQPSRHIYDSFALVSTDGVAGIPVLNENRVMGNTDSGGHLLIPDLNSYQHNRLAIDSLVLPADASIPVDHLDVVPRSQSGVLAHFAVRRYTAATVILVDARGQPLPSGTLLHHRESGRDFVVGYDGQAFIEDLDAHNHLAAHNADPHLQLECSASFDYQRPADSSTLPTLGPISCTGGAPP
ncbi:MAG TPA: fimbria/pilus outer membrane usher protein [Nevskia sp.]|nr:fimbria/pilus outer membrane usher protein [Nevskia sp.]